MPLEQILAFLLKESESIKSEFKKENEAQKTLLGAKFKEIEDRLEQETNRFLCFHDFRIKHVYTESLMIHGSNIRMLNAFY